MSSCKRIGASAVELKRELPLLCASDPRFATIPETSEAFEKNSSFLTPGLVSSIVDAAADFIVQPCYSLTVARHFREILTDLVARATCSQRKRINPLETTLALSRLLFVYPQIHIFVLNYVKSNHVVFQTQYKLGGAIDLSLLKKHRYLSEIMFRLLKCSDDYRGLWNYKSTIALATICDDPITNFYSRKAASFLVDKCVDSVHGKKRIEEVDFHGNFLC